MKKRIVNAYTMAYSLVRGGPFLVASLYALHCCSNLYGSLVDIIILYAIALGFVALGIYWTFVYWQYAYVYKDKIVLRCILYKIQELPLKDCFYEIKELGSSIVRFSTEHDKWICIYPKTQYDSFTRGLQNSRKLKGIQLKYNKRTLAFVKEHIGEPSYPPITQPFS